MKQDKKKKRSFHATNEGKKHRPNASTANVGINEKKKNYNKNLIWILAGIAVLTLIVYSKAIGNGFTNWDEEQYIVNNPVLRSFNFKALFTHFLEGNYHPVTEFVYSIEYHLWGLTEKKYHLVSILIHICNTVFVFYTILLLSKKTEIATVASLLFAVHPLHVESVAWVAELKDLLYTFFFLASYICYIKYNISLSKKFYFFSLLLFLLSLLSKAMAASLPVLFMLTDYFMGRKLNMKIIFEKIPFFALSFILGVVAIYAQHSAGAIQDVADFPLLQRVAFACYGFMDYLYKLIVPANLCAFYPFPQKTAGGIPSWYYLFPFLFLALAACVLYSMSYTRKMFFGIGFFLITVFLVLQLLPVGSAITADRYSYIPSIGIFYLAGEGFYWLWNKKFASFRLRVPVIVLLIVMIASFSYVTYARSAVWKDSLTMWSDVINKYPTVAPAYNNRGRMFLEEKNYDAALNDFNMAVKLLPGYSRALNNRGVTNSKLKKYDAAKSDYDAALKYDPTYTVVYANRGEMLLEAGRYDEALSDFTKNIELNSDLPEAFYSRARAEISLGKKDAGCMDLQQSINLGYQPAEQAYNYFCH